MPGGVQGYDRYAYVNNNPVRYVDPSGHKPCTIINNEDCDGTEENVIKLLDYVEDKILTDKKDRIRKQYTSLEAMEMVVEKAARIFGKDWNGFLDATTYVFTGYYGHGHETMWEAHQSNFTGYFDGDSGCNSDFVDGSNQVRHFWAAFATAVDPYNDNPAGVATAGFGNWFHDIASDRFGTPAKPDGATIIDYELSVTGIDIAAQVGNEIKTPFELAKVLSDNLGTDGVGYTSDSYVNLNWWITPWH